MQATLTIGGHSRPCTILKTDPVKGYFIQLASQKMWVSKTQVTLPILTSSEADLIIQQDLS